jgi:hypothetical protein
LFTRVAATEEELRTVEDILAKVLDILAEVKANQDKIRQDHDARRELAERAVSNRGRSWRRLRESIRSLSWHAGMPFSRLFARDPSREPEPSQRDERTFWKIIGRIAIAGLFLMTIFLVGLYRLVSNG